MKRIVSACLLGIGLCGVVEGGSYAGLLPADSALVVEVSNMKRILAEVEKSSLGRLWNDAKVQDFLGHPDLDKLMSGELDDTLGPAEKEQRRIQWEMMKMLKGRILLGFRVEDDEPHIVADLAPADYRQSLAMDQRLLELDKESEVTITRSRFMGVDVYCRRTPQTGNDPNAVTVSEQWSSLVGATLLVSPHREWVRKSISRLKNSPAGLAPATSTVRISLDLPVFLDGIAKEAAEAREGTPELQGAPFPPPDPQRILAALGLRETGVMRLEIALLADRAEVDFRLPVKDMEKGIFRLIDLSGVSPDIRVPYVAGGVVGYKASRVDLFRVWQALPQIIMATLPPERMMAVPGMIGWVNGTLGVDLGNDLLVHLGTQVVGVHIVEDGEQGSVTGIELKNELGLKSGLAKVFAQGGPLESRLGSSLKRETFRENPVYEIGATNRTFAFSVADGYLFYGAGEAVRYALRALGDGGKGASRFYASPMYRRLVQEIPRPVAAYSFANLPELVRGGEQSGSGWNALEQALRAAAAARSEQPFFANMDFSKMPGMAHFASFFGPWFSYTEKKDNTIHSRTKLYYQSATP